MVFIFDFPLRSPTIEKTDRSKLKVQLNLLDFIPVIRNLRKLKRAKKAKGLEPDTYFVPKGELVLELKDSLGNLIKEKRHSLTMYSAIAWEKLVSDLEIKEDGNLKVYIDNASSDKVYFDNFEIERTEATVAVVVQENHYYPFGMNMKGIEELDLQSLGNTDEHRFQYNGKEKEESFGLNWTDYGFRNLDVQTGRFISVDPLSEKYVSSTSYHYVDNNPISRVDRDGLDWNVSISGSEKDGWNISFSFTGRIINESGKEISEEEMTEYSDRMLNALEKSFTGKSGKNSWSFDRGSSSITSGSEGDLKENEHAIRIADDLTDGNGNSLTGKAQFGQKVIYINSNILDNHPTQGNENFAAKTYAQIGLTANGKATLERTFAHEAGHSAYLMHPIDQSVQDRTGKDYIPKSKLFQVRNLMNQTQWRADAGWGIIFEQAIIMNERFKEGYLNGSQTWLTDNKYEKRE